MFASPKQAMVGGGTDDRGVTESGGGGRMLVTIWRFGYLRGKCLDSFRPGMGVVHRSQGGGSSGSEG